MKKHCNKCGEDKKVTDFYRKYKGSDKRNSICKKCTNEVKKTEEYKAQQRRNNLEPKRNAARKVYMKTT